MNSLQQLCVQPAHQKLRYGVQLVKPMNTVTVKVGLHIALEKNAQLQMQRIETHPSFRVSEMLSRHLASS